MDEIWKDVVGYEGLYKVSNMGRVKRLGKVINRIAKDKREGKRSQGSYEQVIILKDKILKPQMKEKGYLVVGLVKDGKQKRIFIHRLVAIAFIPNPNNKPEVNHLNGNKGDNRVDNLEWVTSEENNKHAIKTGLNKGFTGSKISEEDKKWIRENYVYGSREFGQLAMAKKYGVRTKRIKSIIENI